MSVTALFLGHQDISRRLTGNVLSDEMWSLESLSAKEAAGGSVDGMCIPGAVAAKVKDVRRDFFLLSVTRHILTGYSRKPSTCPACRPFILVGKLGTEGF